MTLAQREQLINSLIIIINISDDSCLIINSRNSGSTTSMRSHWKYRKCKKNYSDNQDRNSWGHFSHRLLLHCLHSASHYFQLWLQQGKSSGSATAHQVGLTGFTVSVWELPAVATVANLLWQTCPQLYDEFLYTAPRRKKGKLKKYQRVCCSSATPCFSWRSHKY